MELKIYVDVAGAADTDMGTIFLKTRTEMNNYLLRSLKIWFGLMG